MEIISCSCGNLNFVEKVNCRSVLAFIYGLFWTSQIFTVLTKTIRFFFFFQNIFFCLQSPFSPHLTSLLCMKYIWEIKEDSFMIFLLNHHDLIYQLLLSFFLMYLLYVWIWRTASYGVYISVLHRLLGMVSMAYPPTTTIKIPGSLRFHDNTSEARPMGCGDRSETGSFHQSTCLKTPEDPSLKFLSGSVTVTAQSLLLVNSMED